MKTKLKIILVLAGVLLAPLQIHAHTAGAALNGWHDGFNHPLHGWDHLLVMIAVGLWAAQQRGRAVWLIPLTFVGVMSLGGIVGVTGISLPGVETAILVSVAVFSVLVARRIHLRTATSCAGRRVLRVLSRVRARGRDARLGQPGDIWAWVHSGDPLVARSWSDHGAWGGVGSGLSLRKFGHGPGNDERARHSASAKAQR